MTTEKWNRAILLYLLCEVAGGEFIYIMCVWLVGSECAEVDSECAEVDSECAEVDSECVEVDSKIISIF